MTLNLACVHYLQGWVPDQRCRGRFRSERHFDKVDSALNWKDVNPRLASPTMCSQRAHSTGKRTGRYVTFQNTAVARRATR